MRLVWALLLLGNGTGKDPRFGNWSRRGIIRALLIAIFSSPLSLLSFSASRGSSEF